jgi:hypothetical protein
MVSTLIVIEKGNERQIRNDERGMMISRSQNTGVRIKSTGG